MSGDDYSRMIVQRERNTPTRVCLVKKQMSMLLTRFQLSNEAYESSQSSDQPFPLALPDRLYAC